jgi:hypothetical protein
MYTESNQLDLRKKMSPEVYGRECAGCHRDLDWVHYRKESSQSDGRTSLCHECENAPRMSVSEHTAHTREKNFSAAASQRARHQDDYKNDEARRGRQMMHSDFLFVLKRLVPDLYITEGRIEGDLAIFRTYAGPQTKLEGRDFEYLFYIPTGLLPEFSIWEFDTVRDIRVKEKQRGWRTILLRLIKLGLLTEDTCNKVYGRPDGQASTVWYRELFEYRNQMLSDK